MWRRIIWNPEKKENPASFLYRSASKLNPRRLWSIRRQSTENISLSSSSGARRLSSSSMASAAANAAAERVIPAISEPPIEESVDESSIMGSEGPSFEGGLRPMQQDFFSVIDEVSCESKPVSENNVSVV